jgi:ribosomal protein S18 acetylase RimI-like enzyme
MIPCVLQPGYEETPVFVMLAIAPSKDIEITITLPDGKLDQVDSELRITFERMIRRLTVDDINIFREIREEAIRTNPESFGSPEEQQGIEQQESAYQRWLKGEVWGIFEDGKLVGTAGFYLSSDKRSQHRGHIFMVYVRSTYRGKGLGDQLIKYILALAENRVDQVHLCVIVTSKPAIKTYLRNGFEIYGTDPRVLRLGDITYDEYLMVRKFR